MKMEISIEEKARRYDEAYKKVAVRFGSNVADEIFPELKESEDERIRKGIIRNLEYLMDRAEGFVKDELKERIAWLEKQGEKELVTCPICGWEIEKQGEPSIKWNKNTEGNKPQVNHTVLMKTTHGITEGEWKGEYWLQYRWSSSVKDSDVLSWIELSDLEKQGEKKPTEWHEKTKGLDELETYILSIAPNRPLDAVKVDAKNIRFLINKEQNSSWSEEDDIMKQHCHQMLALLRPNSSELTKDIIDNCHHWLKSLKGRYTWKPSDEQMLALDSAIHCYAGISPTNNREVYALEIMKEQLKKLRGE